MKPPAPETLTRLAEAAGPGAASTDPDILAPFLVEWRDRFAGEAPLLLRPATTEAVARVLRIAHETRTPIVPQGGNTGLVGGQIPRGEVLLSLARMRRIRDVDSANFTLTAEAGCVLSEVQAVAEKNGRLFPLSLASEGTAQIGGLLSTNAGGTNVLRYGNARDLVLGLEVVLADGRVWNGLRGLRKDNTGYDLKQLFLGAEGTLGVITAAVLKLFARPHDRATAFVALPSPAAAVALLGRAREAAGEDVTGFELIPRIGLEFVLKHAPGARDPLRDPAPWYALVELTSARGGGLAAIMEAFLGQAVENNDALDAAIAQNAREADALWALRDALSEAQKPEGGSIKNDIAVPVSCIPEFLALADKAVAAACPGIRPVAFGHIGDGNVHYNLSQPPGADKSGFLARWEELAHLVEDIATGLGGSISAEHGIGILKQAALARAREPLELDLQRRLKAALDPEGILNPGKLLAATNGNSPNTR